MPLQTKEDLLANSIRTNESSKINERRLTKDYVDFLSEAGWSLEKKLPSNISNYSDLLEDTDWKSNGVDLRCSKHYRRDLDALS